MKLKSIVILLFPLSCFAYEFDHDVPQNIQSQIKNDLAFIDTIQSDTQSQLHQKIFGPVSGSSYNQFFNSRVLEIGLDDCGDSNAVACVNSLFNSSKMWLTENYMKFSHPQIARIMIVFHEARHTEDRHDNWTHASCPSPFLNQDGTPMKSIWTGAKLAGEAACDITPLGSYGSATIMLKNISKFCTNCSGKVKMDAGIYADDQLKRIINPRALQQMHDDLYKI